MKKISGVDGCKGGWLAFHFNGKNWSQNLFREINELYSASDSNLILIDIQIGLRTSERPFSLHHHDLRFIVMNID